MVRHDRTGNAPVLGPTAQVMVVILPYLLPRGLDARPNFQLRVQEGRQHVTHHIARPDIDPRILVHLSAEKPAAIRALLADDFGPLDQGRVIDEQRAALAASNVLGFMETLRSQAAE